MKYYIIKPSSSKIDDDLIKGLKSLDTVYKKDGQSQNWQYQNIIWQKKIASSVKKGICILTDIKCILIKKTHYVNKHSGFSLL